MNGCYLSKNKCNYCKGRMIAIKINNGKYVVQCEKCGIIEETYLVIKESTKPSRMKKVRELKKRFFQGG